MAKITPWEPPFAPAVRIPPRDAHVCDDGCKLHPRWCCTTLAARICVLCHQPLGWNVAIVGDIVPLVRFRMYPMPKRRPRKWRRGVAHKTCAIEHGLAR